MKLSELFKNNKVFIPYITAGDPDLETTEKLIYTLEKAGADAIELGIPFSDPIADGPVIQKAQHRALVAGTTLKKIFTMVGRVRQQSSVPLLFMMSYNSVIQFGQTAFIQALKDHDIGGLVVPDLPFEESAPLCSELKAFSIPVISFVAPTTSPQRIKKITQKANGFIYLISSTGVTGERQTIETSVNDIIKNIKRTKEIPIAVGFGISTPEMAKRVAQFADGIIIGSAIVKIIEAQKQDCIDSVYEFAKSVKVALLK